MMFGPILETARIGCFGFGTAWQEHLDSARDFLRADLLIGALNVSRSHSGFSCRFCDARLVSLAGATVAIGDDPFLQPFGGAFVDHAGIQQERGDFVRGEEWRGHVSPLSWLKRTWSFGFTRTLRAVESRLRQFDGEQTPEFSQLRRQVVGRQEPSDLPE